MEIKELDDAGIRYIYTLECPITNEVRYIGQTNNIKGRYNKHLCSAKNPQSYSQCWIKSILDNGNKPVIKILDNDIFCDIDVLEKMYIGLFKTWGFNLTNLESGGCKNKVVHDSTKEKLRVANTGKKQTEESIKKRILSLKITWDNPELRELKSIQSRDLAKRGIISKKGIPSKKKGKPFAGDKDKLSQSLKEFFSNNTVHNKTVFHDEAQLIADYNSDIPLKDLAKKYNVGRTTITSFIKEKKIPFKNGRKKIPYDVLYKLRKVEDKSIVYIASELNCSAAQVEKYIKKYKIYKNGRNYAG